MEISRSWAPSAWAAAATAGVIVGTTVLAPHVLPHAEANHTDGTKAYQGNDYARANALYGEGMVFDKECDGHHVVVDIAYTDSDGDKRMLRVKDLNGCDAGGDSWDLAAYAMTSFRVGENTGDKNAFGNWIYTWGDQVVFDYSH